MRDVLVRYVFVSLMKPDDSQSQSCDPPFTFGALLHAQEAAQKNIKAVVDFLDLEAYKNCVVASGAFFESLIGNPV